MTAFPATIPIDQPARNGCYQLVFGGDAEFACVRWDGGKWAFSSGTPLAWEPEAYAPTGGLRA